MRLAGAVTQGSGRINEDGLGFQGNADDVTAAWVLDGVTGINGRSYLPAETDAVWLVGQAHNHLQTLVNSGKSLPEIMFQLVAALIADWQQATRGMIIPEKFDPPGACLILAKRFGTNWQAARLGDSCLLARSTAGKLKAFVDSPNNEFEVWLTAEATRRRSAGILDMKSLQAEFQPQLAKARTLRNTPGGYSILEAHSRALEFIHYADLGEPEELLLCTDGYYRAVDHYALLENEGLLAASARTGGVDDVLRRLRGIEAADPECRKYPRFKPADDATAVALVSR